MDGGCILCFCLHDNIILQLHHQEIKIKTSRPDSSKHHDSNAGRHNATVSVQLRINQLRVYVCVRAVEELSCVGAYACVGVGVRGVCV